MKQRLEMVSIDEGIQIDFKAKFFHNSGSGQDSKTTRPKRPSKQTRDSGNPPSPFNPQQPFTSSFDLSSAGTRKPISRGGAFIIL
jgi:hypothetical protein